MGGGGGGLKLTLCVFKIGLLCRGFRGFPQFGCRVTDPQYEPSSHQHTGSQRTVYRRDRCGPRAVFSHLISVEAGWSYIFFPTCKGETQLLSPPRTFPSAGRKFKGTIHTNHPNYQCSIRLSVHIQDLPSPCITVSTANVVSVVLLGAADIKITLHNTVFLRDIVLSGQTRAHYTSVL